MTQHQYSGQNKPLISVIVPCHNAVAYLPQCIESILTQTLGDLELICVDDASTDGSTEVLREYEARDERVHVVALKEQSSPIRARREAILRSRGEFILFVDADDYLDVQACEQLSRQAQESKVDILHFGTSVINCSAGSPAVLKGLERLLRPLGKRIDRNVHSAAFLRNQFGYTLWNKIYRGNLVREAMAATEDLALYMGEDLYMFFVIAYFARSYQGIPEKYYNYRFGAGVTGAKVITVDGFRRHCNQGSSAKAVLRFAKATGDTECLKAAKQISDRLLDGCLHAWINDLPIESAAEGFGILLAEWSIAEVAKRLYVRHFDLAQGAARRMRNAECLKASPREGARKVGFFYHRMRFGGVERVLAQLIPLLAHQGVGVVLFTDEYDPDNEFTLPASVKRIILPPPKDYTTRARVLEHSLKEYEIDVYVHLGALSPTLLSDMVVVKSVGVPTIVNVHHFALHPILSDGTELFSEPEVLKVADSVFVLTPVDELYWRSLGVRATCLQNPAEYDPVPPAEITPEPGLMLWVGRLDPITKRCFDLVDVMARVVAEIPNARLLVVGSKWGTADVISQMKRQAVQAGVESNICFIDETADVEQYYRRASIYLMTSVSEGSPMVLMETKAHGLPVVMYDIPHLQTIGEDKGAVVVESGDKAELARATVELLRDHDRWTTLSKHARDSLSQYREFPLVDTWKKILDEAARGDTDYEDFAPRATPEHTTALMREMLTLQQLKWERDEASRREARRLKQARSSLSKKAKLVKAIKHPRWAARAVARRLRNLVTKGRGRLGRS